MAPSAQAPADGAHLNDSANPFFNERGSFDATPAAGSLVGKRAAPCSLRTIVVVLATVLAVAVAVGIVATLSGNVSQNTSASSLAGAGADERTPTRGGSPAPSPGGPRRIRLTTSDDFATVMQDRAAFTAKLRSQIASALGLQDSSRVFIEKVYAASVGVIFYVKPRSASGGIATDAAMKTWDQLVLSGAVKAKLKTYLKSETVQARPGGSTSAPTKGGTAVHRLVDGATLSGTPGMPWLAISGANMLATRATGHAVSKTGWGMVERGSVSLITRARVSNLRVRCIKRSSERSCTPPPPPDNDTTLACRFSDCRACREAATQCPQGAATTATTGRVSSPTRWRLPARPRAAHAPRDLRARASTC